MLWRIFFAVALLALVACGQSEPEAAANEIAFSDVCDEANDGERVGVEGYLRLPDSFTGDQSMILWLYETDKMTGPYVGVQTPIGSEANAVENVADQFADEDLTVHLADGQVAGFGTKVRVSGKVYFPIVEQAFACALENPFFEFAR